MNYFLADGGAQRGPYTLEQLRQLHVTPETLVWTDGMTQWVRAGSVAALTPLFGAPAMPLPVQYATPVAALGTYDAYSSKRLGAGITGIVLFMCGLAGFGIHKFIAGLNSGGATMLALSLASIGLVFITCGIAWPVLLVLNVIGLIESIIYLAKSDEQFYHTYVVGKRQWF